MKTPQVLCLLFVLTFACSCSKTDDSEKEEPSVVEQSYQLAAILTDKQSLHFTYNEQGQVSHSEEKDTLSENTRYNVERDYSYVLTDGLIFSRSVYHREGEWGTNNRELDYRDTLFLNKQQRVDSIHRHLIADGHIQQWFVLWYKYDDDGQLTELSMKSSQGTGRWSQWQRRGTLVWQDGQTLPTLIQTCRTTCTLMHAVILCGTIGFLSCNGLAVSPYTYSKHRSGTGLLTTLAIFIKTGVLFLKRRKSSEVKRQ